MYEQFTKKSVHVALAAGIGAAVLGGCNNEKPESTCYTYQLGALGNNVKQSGLALLRDVLHYDGSMSDGTFTNLKDASDLITSQLREQREASHSKSLNAGPLSSDIVTLCIEPSNADDIRDGGRFFVGPFVKAIDYAHKVPNPFNKSDVDMIYTLPPNARPELNNLVPLQSTVQ
jgi:hypothetical protein